MAPKQNEIERAHKRISALKALVRAERIRAERNPTLQRNIDLGFIEYDVPRDKAKDELIAFFNDLEILLDHLHVSHLASCFELEAKRRLGTAVGEARKAVINSRKKLSNWPVNLVSGLENFRGLGDIQDVLALPAGDLQQFITVRDCRNEFSHGAQLKDIPDITSDATLILLSGILESMK